MSRVFDVRIVAPGDREESLPERLGVSKFGITEAIAIGIGSLGVGAATSGAIAGGLVNAGIGAGLSALTGGSPLGGALTGGLLGLSGMGFGGSGQGALSNVLGLGQATGAYTSTAPGSAIQGVNVTPEAAGNYAGSYVDAGGNHFMDPHGYMQDQNFGLGGLGATAGQGASQATRNLGMFSALAQALSRPSQANLAAQGRNAVMGGMPLYNKPLQTTGFNNRTQVQGYEPDSGSWYTYGENPEPQFFNHNQLAMPKSFAGGGALTHMGDDQVFSTGGGEHYLDGDDPGMDDSRNAQLSDGEFVMSAQDTANFGDGNNKAGARVLENMRRAVAKDKGFKHPIPPKLKKSPMQYLGEAREAIH